MGKTESISLKVKNKVGLSTFIVLIPHGMEVLATAIRQEERKDIQIRKE